MKLTNDYTLCSVDHEGTTWCHVGNVSEEYILHDRLKVDMLFIITTQTQLGFQRNRISKSSFNTFLNGVTRRIYEVVEKFQNENISCIRDREIFLEHTEQTFVVTLVWRCF